MTEPLNHPTPLNIRYYSHQYNENAECFRRVASVVVNALILTALIAPHLTNSFPAGKFVIKLAGVSTLVNDVRVLPELCLWITGQAYSETDTTTGQIQYVKDAYGKSDCAQTLDGLTIFQNVVALGARGLAGALLINDFGIVNIGLYAQPMVTCMFGCWATVIGIAVYQVPDSKSLWLESVALPCDFGYLSETREMEIVSRSIVMLNDANWTLQNKIIPWFNSNT